MSEPRAPSRSARTENYESNQRGLHPAVALWPLTKPRNGTQPSSLEDWWSNISRAPVGAASWRMWPEVPEKVSSSSQSRRGSVFSLYGLFALMILHILAPSEPNSSYFAHFTCSQTHGSRNSGCCSSKCKGSRQKNAFGTSDNRIRQINFNCDHESRLDAGLMIFFYIYTFLFFLHLPHQPECRGASLTKWHYSKNNCGITAWRCRKGFRTTEWLHLKVVLGFTAAGNEEESSHLESHTLWCDILSGVSNTGWVLV